MTTQSKSTSKPQTSFSETTWKAKFLEAKNLKQQVGESVFRRLKLLREIEADQDFLSEMATLHGKESVSQTIIIQFFESEVLDDMVSFGLGYLDLLQMLKYYPNEVDWRTNNLMRMHEESWAKQKATAKQDTPKRKVIKRAEYEAVVQERDRMRIKADELHQKIQEKEQEYETAVQDRNHLRERASELKQQVSTMETIRISYEELLKENRELKAENKRLRKQITRLEKELQMVPV